MSDACADPHTQNVTNAFVLQILKPKPWVEPKASHPVNPVTPTVHMRAMHGHDCCLTHVAHSKNNPHV